MTTIAFDGTHLAADTQMTDTYGLTSFRNKIITGPDWFAAGTGSTPRIIQWQIKSRDKRLEQLLEEVYEGYQENINDNNIVVLLIGLDGKSYRMDCGAFVPTGRRQFAVGSGRDYALAAMHMGATAEQAVVLASEFDSGTGSQTDCVCVIPNVIPLQEAKRD